MSDALTPRTSSDNGGRPTLHLSGAKLRAALAALIRAAESVGGIERLGEAVRLKAELFQERLGEGRAARIERASFEEIARFMPTVRRRIGPLIAREGWPEVRAAIAVLLADAHVPGTGDSRMAAFESALRASEGLRAPRAPAPRTSPLDPNVNGGGSGRVSLPAGRGAGPAREANLRGDAGSEQAAAPHADPLPMQVQSMGRGGRDDDARAGRGDEPVARARELGGRGQTHGSDHMPNTRFIRDLAAELLHNVWPEHYPLMTRWVWDAATNTGVLREIWHDAATGSEEVDHIVIDVPDGHETHLALREELSQFLSGEGIFRDMIWYVDLISAQIYGDYINAQGGAYLKTDFNAAAPDPLEHTRRILGLDARRKPVASSE